MRRQHARTLIVNRCATTYSLFTMDEEQDTMRSRGLLQMLSGDNLAEVFLALSFRVSVSVSLIFFVSGVDGTAHRHQTM